MNVTTNVLSYLFEIKKILRPLAHNLAPYEIKKS
jgi:hypothetical protein